mmetsp:Transcript_3714/g.7711  ORF Transcript_3714/g.7711 Transcript_3714/m.7711 type:complete len:453 (+) Transcript_3714:34-1392(+)
MTATTAIERAAPLLAVGGLAALMAVLHRARARVLKAQSNGNTDEALITELAEAEARVQMLRSQLAACSPSRSMPRKEIRIWMDGAFDMMHYGHANAFRQGRQVGSCLVVGVNDDESITRCKGPPLMSDHERLAMVSACKWVDEVVPEVPYIMSDDYLKFVIQKYQIDYVVHGDDPCLVDGRDVYESAVRAGKYRTIPRTEGVSTTEIVGRMLLLSRAHHVASHNLGSQSDEAGDAAGAHGVVLGGATQASDELPSFVRESKFMTTSRMLRLFSEGCLPITAGKKIVYVDGGWDMFHAGHVAFLREAAALGDYLLVGVHNDAVVNRHRGSNFPIMNLNERVLSVLSCRFCNDVVIDPPWHLTREMIAALNISVVAHGTKSDANNDGGRDPYHVPKQMGIFCEVESKLSLTIDVIVERIQRNHERISAKVERKMVGEREYYANRYGLGPEAVKA